MTKQTSLPPIAYDDHERECLKIMQQRDEAEEAFARAYEIVLGRDPMFSNLRGYPEMLEEIAEKMA